IGLLVGKVDFSNLFVSLTARTFSALAEAKAAGAPTLNYGLFLNTMLDFAIVAFAMFLIISQVTRLARKQPAEPVPDPMMTACRFCTMQVSKLATRCPHCTSQLTE